MRHRKLLAVVCFLVAGGALAAALWRMWPATSVPAQPSPQAPFQTDAPSQPPALEAQPEASEPASEPEPDDGGLPQDRVVITPAREDYESGTITLVIPKLDVIEPVLNGVDADTLLQGLGLYDYAQLPQETGGNVSIAGHRNGIRHGKITDNMPFYYVDTLGEGDYLYLTYQNRIYQYLWDQATVVEPDDWSVIFPQGFSCLTLTTCTPIGVADHRLIVRARLVNDFADPGTYLYPESVSAEQALSQEHDASSQEEF